MGKILVVDDDRNTRLGLAELLHEFGHEVRIAASAEEAIEQGMAFDSELLVTDFRLPGASGIALLAELKSMSCRTPAILITAYDDSEVRQEAFAAGFVAVLPKPVDIEMLLTFIDQSLENRERAGVFRRHPGVQSK